MLSEKQKTEYREKGADVIRAQAWNCFVKLPNGSGFEVEDVQQEGAIIMERVLERFDTGKGVRFNTTLTRALMNGYSDLVRDAYRDVRKANLYVDEGVLVDEIETTVSSDMASPEDYAEMSTIMEELHDGLDPDGKAILRLYLSPLSGEPRDIAGRLEISLHKVYQTIRRIRRILLQSK